MMVNVSPFNSVQDDVATKLLVYLEEIQREIELEAKKSDNPEKSSSLISSIRNLFEEKFLPYAESYDNLSWSKIKKI